MAVFSVKCPACGESITCDDEWRGRKLECPYCKQTFTIPQKRVVPKKSSPEKKSEYSDSAEKDTSQPKSASNCIPIWHSLLSFIVLVVVVIAGMYSCKMENSRIEVLKGLIELQYDQKKSEMESAIQRKEYEMQRKVREEEIAEWQAKREIKEMVTEMQAEIENMKTEMQAEIKKMKTTRQLEQFFIVVTLVVFTVLSQILGTILLRKGWKSIIRSDSLYPTGRIYIFLHYVEIYLCFAVVIPALAIITLLGVITLWVYFASFSSMLFIAFMLLLSANILRAFFDVADNSSQVKNLLQEALVPRAEQQ